MNDFIIYTFKTIAGLGLFALVYRFVFPTEINFSSRRIYLMVALLLSFVLPSISYNFFTVFSTGQNQVNQFLIDEITVYSNGLMFIGDQSALPLERILLGIYIVVSSFLIVRILFQIVSILIKIKRYKAINNKNIRLYRIPLENTSFSFFRSVFIGKTPEEGDLDKIFAHEKIHAYQLHTIDVIILEFLTVFFWFNPLIWWYRLEIKNVHEYLADDGALREGFNKKAYQITLLEHLIGSAPLSITNNFNYSLIKNRIAMMNKEKNRKKNNWKILLLIPVSLIIAFTFACTEKPLGQDQAGPEVNADLYYETAFDIVDVMPEYPGGLDELRKFIATNIAYPDGAKLNGVSGRVFVQFVVNKEGKVVTKLEEYKLEKGGEILDGVVVTGFDLAEGGTADNPEKYIQELKDEAVRVLSLLPDFEKPAMKDGKAVAIVYTIPISFALQ